MVCEERKKTSVKHYNYSKDYIILVCLKQSLKNLKTDYLRYVVIGKTKVL